MSVRSATRVETVKLPDLGEGLTESDLVEWLVAPGDTVELNQVVAEVETAKALVQLPSPYAGVVAELLVEPGTTVPVGGALLTITVPAANGAGEASGAGMSEATDASVGEAGETTTADEPVDASAGPAMSDAAGAAPRPAVARTSVLVGYGPPVAADARPRRRDRSAAWLAAHAANGAALARGPHGWGGESATPGADDAAPATRPVINPLVRKLAHDLGVHLERVTGTGLDGTITREDVLRAVSGGGSEVDDLRARRTPGRGRSASALGTPQRAGTSVRPDGSGSSARPSSSSSGSSSRSSSGEPTDVRIPVTGVRKQTAAAMVASAFTAPHASVHLTVDVTPALDLLADLQTTPAFAGRRLTLLPLVAKAVLLALGRTPALNGRWDEAAGEIVRHGHVGLGVAVATPRGLLVPVVHDADQLRLPELADAIRGVAEAARAGASQPSDLAGGTITITNIGVFGVDGGTPILVPGQAAILAMGAVQRRPWEHEDQIALRHVMTLGMSFDHRQVDGAEAAGFLHDVGAILARPGAVLAMV